MNKLTIALLLLVFLVTGTASAEVTKTWRWAAPTTGSEVVTYHILSIRAGESAYSHFGDVATNSVTITLPDGTRDFQIKVAGVDAEGQMGPYSVASDPFTYLGPPGQPGKPIPD